MIKIWTQNDFRLGKIVPRPGLVFLGDDNNYYRLMDHHPNLRAGEFGIKYTDVPIPKGEESTRSDHFWAAIPLTDREISILVHGKR